MYGAFEGCQALPASACRRIFEPMNGQVRIWADESCLGNQFAQRKRPGAAAGLVACVDDAGAIRRYDYWIAEPDTTNNRMALLSALVPLRTLTCPRAIAFHSDSRYLVEGMRTWVPAWQARGWRRRGGPIEHLELWQELARLAARHRIEWIWVRGHAGHPENEYAHWLATRAAKEGNASGGLVPSNFEAWLAERRAADRRGRPAG
jgi:ribonuclease HI